MENQGEVKCLDCGHYFKVDDPRTISDIVCNECSSINVKFVCAYCCKDVESVYNAYLQDRSTRSGLCVDCKKIVEEEDLDKITFECFEKLCSCVNGGSVKNLAESMFRTFRRQHRYLQNEVFRTFVEFFKHYGEQTESQRDARNEWAVSVAKLWYNATYNRS